MIRTKTTIILLLGLASLNRFGVDCFSAGVSRQSLKRSIHASTINLPRRVLERVKGFRKIDLPSYILKGQSANDFEQDANLEGMPDSSMNCSGPESVDFLVPAVNATDFDAKSRAGPGTWPCFDQMDKDLIKISLPVIGNFAINPLIGAVDLFWVNRMGNALAVAGQAAANQVFSSGFWITSFLPSGM
jgi:hypothetical protein